MKLTEETIYDLVDQWHDKEEDGVPLHEFLGLTWNDYKLFVENPTEFWRINGTKSE